MKYRIELNGKVKDLEITGYQQVKEGSDIRTLEVVPLDANRFSALIGTRSFVFELYRKQDQLFLMYRNHQFPLMIANERDQLVLTMKKAGKEASGETRLTAPMPGMVTSILVSPGMVVQKGDPILILEAMKMENDIKSPVTGTIQSVAVQSGGSVEKGALLLTIH